MREVAGILVGAFAFGVLLGAAAASIADIWRQRPAVVFDDRKGRWRSARLIRRERGLP